MAEWSFPGRIINYTCGVCVDIGLPVRARLGGKNTSKQDGKQFFVINVVCFNCVVESDLGKNRYFLI